jgi:3-isopropylmalate/(R)-2-methylmalate dehydratase small subunit
VLLTRRNFGCGSSREHAPWALEDYGFRVIVAPSYADIFYNNCFKNGMLPIVLDEAQVDELFARAAKHLAYKLTADLENLVLTDEHGFRAAIDVDPFRRHCLINGLDDIGLTLEHEDKIAAFEARSQHAASGA